jgi:tRNA (mo5U34)-methyltransferase
MPELGIVSGATGTLKVLIDWAPLVQQVPQWQQLTDTLDDAYFARHGDFERWRAALRALPELKVDAMRLREGVQIDGAATAQQQQALRDALMGLHPWRKGPFTLFGVTIDTEWRSDWKWQRLIPHLPGLQGQRILDVGCGNGYFGWRALGAGAACVVGVDPSLLFLLQHLAISRYLKDRPNWLLPLPFEAVPAAAFDTVLSMGVIYHRRDPLEHVLRLYACTRPGGRLVLESLVVTGQENLLPQARYARMRNVHLVPTVTQLCEWMRSAGFTEVETVDVTPTSLEEQRSTSWMHFESLAQALDADNPALTVEGYPAPVRAIVIGQRPAQGRL